MTKSRIAVYGGSFDPPHVVHLLAASWVLACAPVDHLIFVPTFEHALDKRAHARFDDRLAMCRALATLLSRASVSDVERTLETPSRTHRTLEALREAHPDASFRLVLGADIAAETHRWSHWEKVVTLAPPLWLGREGHKRPVDVSFDFPSISSTEVRASLARGDSVESLVPRPVLEHIEAHALYRGAYA